MRSRAIRREFRSAFAAGQAGEIFYEHDGARRIVPALGLEGASIAAGAEVVIERIENGIAHVELWSNIERELEKLS